LRSLNGRDAIFWFSSSPFFTTMSLFRHFSNQEILHRHLVRI
jgi:hypothetical protein